MAKKNIVYERIEDESKTFDRVDPRELANALGAEEIGESAGSGSPFSVWALRSRLLSELVSTGGRPSRRQATSRKVSMTESEWVALDQITSLLKHQGVTATPGQVAGLLLHQSLTEVLQRMEQITPSRELKTNPVTRLTDTKLEETLENVLAAAASAEVQLEQLRPVALELLKRMREEKGEQDGDRTNSIAFRAPSGSRPR